LGGWIRRDLQDWIFAHLKRDLKGFEGMKLAIGNDEIALVNEVEIMKYP